MIPAPAARRGRRLAVAAIAAAVVAGCGVLGGQDDEAGRNDKAEKTTVKVGIIPRLIDIAGFERARVAGYFADEGLEVEPVSIKSATDAVPRLRTSDLDFAFGNWTSFILAQADGTIDLRMVADGLQAKEEMTGLVAMPDAGITSPRELSGKSVGVNALDGNAILTSKAVLEAHDVDPNSVRFEVIPTSKALHALRTKQIDVMSLQEPNLTVAKQKLGVVLVADRATGSVANFPISGYVTSTDFAEVHPKTVGAFQRAMAKGQADLADRQVVEETLLEYADIDENVARTVGVGVFPTSVDELRLQQVADLMVTYRLLDEKFDVGPMIFRAPGP